MWQICQDAPKRCCTHRWCPLPNFEGFNMKTLSGDSRGSKLFKPDGELFKQSTFSIYLGNCFVTVLVHYCCSHGALLVTTRPFGTYSLHIYIYIQLQIYSNILRNIIFSITFQKPGFHLLNVFCSVFGGFSLMSNSNDVGAKVGWSGSRYAL